MPFQWLLDIVMYIWNNLSWIMPLGVFIFLFGMVAPVTKGIRNTKESLKEAVSPLGFAVFIIFAVIALIVSGLIGKLF